MTKEASLRLLRCQDLRVHIRVKGEIRPLAQRYWLVESPGWGSIQSQTDYNPGEVIKDKA